ncbi:MAG: hypothetical protein KJP00_11480 [Bacteroidia bacterium]|nr:hypothetical protein [Bacteroidia bacterium]
MNTTWATLGMLTILNVACMDINDPRTPHQSADHYFEIAKIKMLESQYDSAIVYLTKALESGFENPMAVVVKSEFYHVIDDPVYRPKIRTLLAEYAIEHDATMVRPDEPGPRIFVEVQVLAELDNQPVPNAKIELVQTDIHGRYFDENSQWNPRIFGYLITDEDGKCTIHTIHPGRYKDDQGETVPAHIHFTLEAEGYRTYASEFTFENDTIFIRDGNDEEFPVARLDNPKDQDHFKVTIYLQKE